MPITLALLAVFVLIRLLTARGRRPASPSPRPEGSGRTSGDGRPRPAAEAASAPAPAPTATPAPTTAPSPAAAPFEHDRSASNLMVVLRECVGQDQAEESLVPIGPVRVSLPGRPGAVDETDLAWFTLVGDLRVRFVFDGPTTMLNAGMADLRRFGLTPEAALEVATQNLRRVYGAPTRSPWSGLTEVRGRDPDLNSSYFVDRTFWRGLLRQHPQGLVAIVPHRGVLLYAPQADTHAVERMEAGIVGLHRSSGNLRVSSAVYLFHDDRWTVLSPPTSAPPEA